MRKLCLAMTVVATLLFAPIVMADSKNVNDYYSTKHPKETPTINATNATATATAKALPQSSLSPTNITLINASSDLIVAAVPGSKVNDALYPRNNLHIYNDYLYDDTYLVLKDPYTATFYNAYVCRRAIVTVYGQPGYYSIYIDREFCN